MIRLMVGREIDVEHDAAQRTARTDSEYFRVDGLRTRRYPQHAVSFAVGRGEILGMAGLVGAGRSEIALAIFGIDPPIAGTVSLGGQPLQIETPEDAIRHGMFLVPEDRRVGRARGGLLDSRERVAPGARPIRAARPRLRDGGAPRRGGGLRPAAGQGAVDRGHGGDLERRQPAEGGARQVARARAARC